MEQNYQAPVYVKLAIGPVGLETFTVFEIVISATSTCLQLIEP